MWRERLIRLLLVGVGALLILGVAKAFADWRVEKPLVGKPLSLPELSIEKLQKEDVLGTATRGILGRKKEQVDQGDQVNQEHQEVEPVAEPVENIQEQTQTLIESIKKLPEDQIEAIKKQLFKEFCEELLVEEE